MGSVYSSVYRLRGANVSLCLRLRALVPMPWSDVLTTDHLRGFMMDMVSFKQHDLKKAAKNFGLSFFFFYLFRKSLGHIPGSGLR